MILGNPIYAYSFYETYICFFLTWIGDQEFSPKAEGNTCEIKQVDNSDKVVHITIEENEPIKTYGPEKLLEDRIKRFWIGNYKCGIDIEKLAIEDAGKWTCGIIFNDGTTETGVFNLSEIEPLPTTTLPPTTTVETANTTIQENSSDETESSTDTELSTETEMSKEMGSESPSIGVIIGLIITIIFGIVITIVVLAYFDIIKSFPFLPRRSPGLRQVDEMKRESDLRRRARQSMHTFLDYVEKQGKRKSIFK